MKNKVNFRLYAVPILVVVMLVLLTGSVFAIQLYSDVTNMSGLHLQGTFTTATPALMVDQQGAGKIFELRDSATPVFSVNDGGAVSQSGDLAISGVTNLGNTLTTISGNQTITPSGSVLTVAPTVLSTITLATGSATAGDLLLVLNTVSTNTNIVDTGATAGGGSIDLGTNDPALFIFLNGKWVEIASPDNS